MVLAWMGVLMLLRCRIRYSKELYKPWTSWRVELFWRECQLHVRLLNRRAKLSTAAADVAYRSISYVSSRSIEAASWQSSFGNKWS